MAAAFMVRAAQWLAFALATLAAAVLSAIFGGGI